MGRRGVQIPPVLLGVLSVVALLSGESEEALFQDRVAPVPEGEGQAGDLALIADSAQAVLAPAEDARPGMIVGKVMPGLAVVAVVFTDRAPRPLAEVRTPSAPGRDPGSRLAQAAPLGVVIDHRLHSSWPRMLR